MRLSKGDKLIPGNRPWYRIPENNDIVIRLSRDDSEIARYSKYYELVETGKSTDLETIYTVK